MLNEKCDKFSKLIDGFINMSEHKELDPRLLDAIIAWKALHKNKMEKSPKVFKQELDIFYSTTDQHILEQLIEVITQLATTTNNNGKKK